MLKKNTIIKWTISILAVAASYYLSGPSRVSATDYMKLALMEKEAAKLVEWESYSEIGKLERGSEKMDELSPLYNTGRNLFDKVRALKTSVLRLENLMYISYYRYGQTHVPSWAVSGPLTDKINSDFSSLNDTVRYELTQLKYRYGFSNISDADIATVSDDYNIQGIPDSDKQSVCASLYHLMRLSLQVSHANIKLLKLLNAQAIALNKITPKLMSISHPYQEMPTSAKPFRTEILEIVYSPLDEFIGNSSFSIGGRKIHRIEGTALWEYKPESIGEHSYRIGVSYKDPVLGKTFNIDATNRFYVVER